MVNQTWKIVRFLTCTAIPNFTVWRLPTNPLQERWLGHRYPMVKSATYILDIHKPPWRHKGRNFKPPWRLNSQRPTFQTPFLDGGLSYAFVQAFAVGFLREEGRVWQHATMAWQGFMEIFIYFITLCIFVDVKTELVPRIEIYCPEIDKSLGLKGKTTTTKNEKAGWTLFFGLNTPNPT